MNDDINNFSLVLQDDNIDRDIQKAEFTLDTLKKDIVQIFDTICEDISFNKTIKRKILRKIESMIDNDDLDLDKLTYCFNMLKNENEVVLENISNILSPKNGSSVVLAFNNETNKKSNIEDLYSKTDSETQRKLDGIRMLMENYIEKK